MQKLLVANRAEIARRVIRTARSMGIATVALFSDADEHAPHVAEADEAVALGGDTPAESYLDIDKILAAAVATGADAVHPGYGFLSESAEFARACGRAGLTFVGPSPEAIDAMGSKVAAKELMAGAGVPVLPGVTVTDDTDLAAAGDTVGFPVLVKAAYGGGGRGMRIARSGDELLEAVASAQREAAAAFGDGTVFLERFVDDPRHIEVQVFGDAHGTVIHLFERECSIQRRYQKVIEEAPSPAVDDERRAALGKSAVAAAEALGYVGAGTVEFVMDQGGEFFFLEVNTRLQVEHPVTELITGLDLVELQLRVARGEPLPQRAVQATITGHAVEARLYAEDVAAGFVPTSGRIDRLTVPAGEGIRLDSGYETGSVVSTYYDAMLAKVVAHGDDREQAVRRLADALAAAQVHGVPTNRDLLVRTLRHPEFGAGRTDTGFLDRHDLAAGLTAAVAGRHAVAAALTGAAGRRAAAPVQPLVPAGWRNVPAGPQVTRFDDEEVRYRHTRHGVEVEGLGEVRVWSVTPDEIDLTIAGVRQRVSVHWVGDVAYVDDAGGSSTLREIDRLPLPGASTAAGSLLAPLPGSVVRVLAAAGDAVTQGQTIVVLEAMKMEHAVQSPAAGTVSEVRVELGDQVASGQILAVVEEPGG